MHHIDMYSHFLHAYHLILACTSYFYSTEQTSASNITFISVIYNLVVIYKIHNMHNNSIRKTNINLAYAPTIMHHLIQMLFSHYKKWIITIHFYQIMETL